MRYQIVICALLALIAASTARADEVIRKDGKSVKGFVVSQSSKYVRVLDASGRTHRIAMKDVDSILEGPDTGDADLNAKLGEIDADDADELAEVAKEAKSGGNKAWKVVAMMALRVDEEHAEAHELLGHILVGDEWFTSKKKAEAARKKLVDKRMKEEGYVRWRSGWISKEDRSKASKDPKAFVKSEEGVWREKAVVMREKGYELVGGKWIKAGTLQDKADRAEFKKLMFGEDIWVLTTEHFRLYVMDTPPEEVSKLGELVEQSYDWCLEKLGLEADTNLFANRGGYGHMWLMKDRDTSIKWVEKYRQKLSLGDGFATLVQRSGNCLSSGSLLYVGVIDEARSRVRHTLVNHAAQFVLKMWSPGLGGGGKGQKGDFSYWLYECFGVHAEHELLGNGVVVHSTLAKYGDDAGRANKAFETKDANDRCEGYARTTADPIASIDGLQDLNMLSGDHMAKGYTILRWMMTSKVDEFRAWLKQRRTMRAMDALEKAFGVSPTQVDDKWHDMVRDGF